MIDDSFKQDLELVPQADSGDEYDGLDLPKKKSRPSLWIILFCLLLLGGGGFFAYTFFFSEPELPFPVAPLQDNIVAPTPDPAAGAAVPVPAEPAAEPENESAAAASSSMASQTPDPSLSAEALPAPQATAPETSIKGETGAASDSPVSGPVQTTTTTSVETSTADPATGVPAVATVTTTTQTAAPTDAQKLAQPPADSASPPVATLQTVDNKTATSPVMPPPLDPLPATVSGSPAAMKTAQAIDAVNNILGEPAIVTPQAQKALVKQVEVTPRASQVIIVKKTYSSQSPRAVNAAGDRVLEAGQYGEAVEIYNRQLRNNPSDPLALGGKAVALQRAGRDKEAMDTYQHLLELNPRDVEALTNYLGLLQKQNPEQAMTRLNILEQQYPENAAVSGQAGMIYAGLMDTPNALRAFQKAAALDPTNPTYPFNMAVLYDRLGTVDKAREAYHYALGVAQNYPDKAHDLPVEIIRKRLRGIAP